MKWILTLSLLLQINIIAIAQDIYSIGVENDKNAKGVFMTGIKEVIKKQQTFKLKLNKDSKYKFSFYSEDSVIVDVGGNAKITVNCKSEKEWEDIYLIGEGKNIEINITPIRNGKQRRLFIMTVYFEGKIKN